MDKTSLPQTCTATKKTKQIINKHKTTSIIILLLTIKKHKTYFVLTILLSHSRQSRDMSVTTQSLKLLNTSSQLHRFILRIVLQRRILIHQETTTKTHFTTLILQSKENTPDQKKKKNIPMVFLLDQECT